MFPCKTDIPVKITLDTDMSGTGHVATRKKPTKQEMFVKHVCPPNNSTLTLTFDLETPNSLGFIY